MREASVFGGCGDPEVGLRYSVRETERGESPRPMERDEKGAVLS